MCLLLKKKKKKTLCVCFSFWSPGSLGRCVCFSKKKLSYNSKALYSTLAFKSVTLLCINKGSKIENYSTESNGGREKRDSQIPEVVDLDSSTALRDGLTAGQLAHAQ